jgi:pilus assembly protein CpaF
LSHTDRPGEIAFMVSIVIEEKNGRPQTREFPQDEVTVGRVPGNDIVLPKSNISKRHCRFFRQGEEWLVSDASSTNGTFLNGQKLAQAEVLRDGDQIQLGDFTLVLRPAAGAAAQAPASERQATTRVADARPTFAPRPSAQATRELAPEEIDAAAAAMEGDLLPDDGPVPVESRVLARSRATSQVGALPQPGGPVDIGSLPEEQSGLVQVVHERLAVHLEQVGGDPNDEAALQSRVEQAVRAIVADMAHNNELPPDMEPGLLIDCVLTEAIGFGPLQELLDDPSVTEILVNNARQIYVERAGRLETSHLVFSSDRAVLGVIERIVAPLGRRIDYKSPMVDARLRDGSRVNAVIPPLAVKGPTITIRKFGREPLQIDDLVAGGSLNADMAEFLEVCVKARKTIIVSGGTGSGKTTLLNVLSSFIDTTERIITIEDAAELNLEQAHVVSLESRPGAGDGATPIGIRELVRNALRMRPDRIIVGECRGEETLDMLQAMNTGHDGSLTTVHANSPRDALARLETLVLMGGVELPSRAIREQVSSAIDIIVQQARFPDGSRRITHISEITGMEGDVFSMHDLFKYEQQGMGADNRISGRFRATGVIPKFYEQLRAQGQQPNLALFRHQ